MTYRPKESVFGAPIWARLPSFAYLLVALGVGAVVLLGESSGSNTWLFHYVVVQDKSRVMSIRTFSYILIASAVASVVRASMRGVRIYPDGVESRDVLSLVIPRLKRYRWPQIECIVLDQKTTIALDLWDGTRAFLPRVDDRQGLAQTLEQIAAARAIPVRGGSFGGDFIDEEEEELD